jgi:hypothetical protein
MTYSNISVYKSIAEDSFQKMKELIESNRSPKSDGSEGWIIQYDPSQNSFKQAMITLVFTGMWLESLLHQKIIHMFGEEKFKEYDRKSYEEKLKLVGINDSSVIERAERFRKCRKDLVHEKAHFDNGEIKIAQKEAENARQLLLSISEALS